MAHRAISAASGSAMVHCPHCGDAAAHFGDLLGEIGATARQIGDLGADVDLGSMPQDHGRGDGESLRVSLIASIERRPGAAFGWFLVIHAALWTALPALLYPNLPLDLIEALTFGREWQLGYYKLPPLPWWLVEVVYRAVGRDAAYYLLAQVAVVSAFAAVYALARPLVGAMRALVALLIIDGLHYFNYTAAKFNHDVIQLPLWAVAMLAYYHALRGGRLRWWALLGFAIGASLWAKYFVVVLALPLALFLLLDREARVHLRTPGPYLAGVVALIVMAPHLLWLVTNDFLPFAYAEQRAVTSRSAADHILHPLAFAAGQLLFLLPALAIAAPLVLGHGRAPVAAAADAFDRRIVALLTFGPVATVLALSALTGRGTIAMWGYPLWLCLGLWIVMVLEPALDRLRLGRIVGTWALIIAATAIAFIANYGVLPSFDDRYRAVHYPGPALATEISQRFRTATGQPLRYVVGDMWDAGNVAHYSPDHPQVLVDGRTELAPWIDLGDLKRRGAVLLWTSTDPPPAKMPADYAAVAPGAVVQPPFVLPFRRGPLVLHVNWAILYPSRL
jgi:hypothetical protein